MQFGMGLHKHLFHRDAAHGMVGNMTAFSLAIHGGGAAAVLTVRRDRDKWSDPN